MALYDLLKCLLLLRVVAAYPLETGETAAELCTDGSSGCTPTELEQEYMLILDNSSHSLVTVYLKMKQCLVYDPNNPLDIKSYTIEAITSDEKPIGMFTDINKYLDAAEHSTDNMIVFQSNHPSVMDFPARYRWKPNHMDTHQSVCFRATMIKESSNETFTKCTLPHENVFHAANAPTEATSAPTPTSEPSTKKCSRWQNCTEANAKLNYVCGNNNVTYPSRCAMRYDSCISDTTIIAKKGKCPEPAIQRGPCGDNPWCSNLGYYKSIQCAKTHGSVRCWCSDNERDIVRGDIHFDVTCETNFEVPNCYST